MRPKTARLHARGPKGVSLIELMVAVSMLGIVAMGLGHGISAQRSLAIRVHHAEAARQVLDYHAEALMAGVDPEANVSSALLELLPEGSVTYDAVLAGQATEIMVTWRRAGGGTASSKVVLMGVSR